MSLWNRYENFVSMLPSVPPSFVNLLFEMNRALPSFLGSFSTTRIDLYGWHRERSIPPSARLIRHVQRMALVDVRSAVERHAYAPGCRPKAPQTPPSWREGHRVRGKGRATGTSRIPSPTLTGVFDGA